MKKEIVFKRCPICGALVRVVEDGPMMCCGKVMEEVHCNSKDYASEKHLPTYEQKEDKIVVTVPHVMNEDHYIMWIGLVNEKEEMVKKLVPGKEAVVTFPKIEDAVIYSYCNQHGLWKIEVN